MRKLATQSRKRLRDDVVSLDHSAQGPHLARRVALRFFTWYVMEVPDFTSLAMKGEAPITNALEAVQSWCEGDPELVKAVAPDPYRLRVHLFHVPEKVG